MEVPSEASGLGKEGHPWDLDSRLTAPAVALTHVPSPGARLPIQEGGPRPSLQPQPLGGSL